MQNSASSSYSHLFGPVPSRRLGRSLGIDVVAHKTCSLNCVYCECGPTTTLSMERREYVPYGEIVAQIDSYLSENPALDAVTFAGSGEPTLHSRLGDIITHVKERFPQYKLALLTNGTLLHSGEVQRENSPADYVLPSLDAVSQKLFEALNRPAPGLTSQMVIDGLVSFSQQYRGCLRVEVFIVPGMNDTPQELALIKEVLGKVKLDRVQLNTLDRPGSCEWVQPASSARLREIAEFLAPIPVEIISRNADHGAFEPHGRDIENTVLAAVKRRPCTVDDLSVMCGRSVDDLQAVVKRLLRVKLIVAETVAGNTFYRSHGTEAAPQGQA